MARDGGVQHHVDILAPDARRFEQLLHPGDHRCTGIARRGGHLQGKRGSIRAVVQNKIGEGAANVERHADHWTASAPLNWSDQLCYLTWRPLAFVKTRGAGPW